MTDGKRVYIAATRQNDGKTIVSLGLFAALKKRFKKVGYIKPVGQHYLVVNGKKIDKDAVLIDQVYQPNGKLSDMSPIAVPHGFTEDYILRGKKEVLVRRIKQSFRNIQKENNFVLIEGTGHAGVGSVFDLSNSEVASQLKARVIIVSIGGIGRPIDEIMLNKAMFDQKGVEVLGVIINKVQEKKLKKIARFVTAGLARKKIEVLGIIPYREVLSSPTMRQLLEDLDGKLLGGANGLDNALHRMIIGAMPPHEALGYFGRGTLLITPGSREDLILAALSGSLGGHAGAYGVSGIILTGKITPHKHVQRIISSFDIPIVQVRADTFSVASYIHDLIIKIRSTDTEKIRAIEELIENYVDIDRIMRKLV